jgi:hypothetical protein
VRCAPALGAHSGLSAQGEETRKVWIRVFGSRAEDLGFRDSGLGVRGQGLGVRGLGLGVRG